jgi:hypothetical protein
MLSKLGAENEVLGFIGNAVGALTVGVIGNKKPVDFTGVNKFITALMK